MGQCLHRMSSEDPVNESISRMILVEERRKPIPELLFLGTGESGKSTFVRQMRLLHGDGLSHEDLMNYRDTIKSMIMLDIQKVARAVTMSAVLQACPTAKHLPDEANDAIAAVIASGFGLSTSMAHFVSTILNDPIVQQVLQYRSIFGLGDHCLYFFNQFEHIMENGWVPTQQDYINFRVKTTSVTETIITMRGRKLKLIDVGGQRGERRKWICRFDHAAAIVFVVALSEYDQMLAEDNTVSRMMESVNVFKTIINEPSLQDCGIILFLNKNDIFREKLKTVPFNVPDYIGDGSYESASAHVKALYESIAMKAPTKSKSRQIYTHFTTAIDTNNVRNVFKDVIDMLLCSQLDEIN